MYDLNQAPYLTITCVVQGMRRKALGAGPIERTIRSEAPVPLAKPKHFSEGKVGAHQRGTCHGTGFKGQCPQVFSLHV